MAYDWASSAAEHRQGSGITEEDRREEDQRLAHVEGCVELTVRITPTSPDEARRTSRRDSPGERAIAQRRREALAESTLACLREFAVDSRITGSPSVGDTVSISYLVKSGGVERFSRAVERLRRRWPEFGLSCTGPRPPYSFVNGRPRTLTAKRVEILPDRGRVQRLVVRPGYGTTWRRAHRLAQASSGASASSSRRPSRVSP